jgi:menaquinone-specific isochorismate synthase
MAEPYGNYRDTDGHPGGANGAGRAGRAGGVGRADGEYDGEHLVVRSVLIPDPGDLVRRLPQPAALAWIRHGAGLAGWGEAARVTLPAGDDRFTAGEKWLREVFEGADVRDEACRRGSGLVAFGSFTFDDCSEGSVLVVPRAVIGRDGAGAAWLTTITPQRGTLGQDQGGQDQGGQDQGGQQQVGLGGRAVPPDGGVAGGWGEWGAGSPPFGQTVPPGVKWHDGSLSAPEWEQAVAAAVGRITRGDLRKVVLARDLYASADAPIDPRVLLRRLAARYPDCFTFACAGLVGATPELLIRRDGREVSSLVLAGTKPRGATAAEDDRLAAELTSSLKENEEHRYAAASLREALAPLCEALEVAGTPELIKYANVQHLGTRVRGTLAVNRSALALVAALHPTAAVGGTPTDAAVELIRELESMDRERYAGPVGWMDAEGNGEWGIALRCAQLDGRRARLFAGCGIVAGSDPAAELAETQVKFRPMQTALEQPDLSVISFFVGFSKRSPNLCAIRTLRSVSLSLMTERQAAYIASDGETRVRGDKPGFTWQQTRSTWQRGTSIG